MYNILVTEFGIIKSTSMIYIRNEHEFMDSSEFATPDIVSGIRIYTDRELENIAQFMNDILNNLNQPTNIEVAHAAIDSIGYVLGINVNALSAIIHSWIEGDITTPAYLQLATTYYSMLLNVVYEIATIYLGSTPSLQSLKDHLKAHPYFHTMKSLTRLAKV